MTQAIRRWVGRVGLTWRLVAAMMTIEVVTALTTSIFTFVVGPRLFWSRMQAGDPVTESIAEQSRRAFQGANLVAIAMGLALAFAASLTISAAISRRIGRAATRLSSTATRIADGDYGSPPSRPRIGPELDSVADALARMAQRLDTVESNRRRLLADLGHEARTPITVLDGHLEAIEDGIITPDEEVVALLREQTRRLSRLTEDINAISAAEEGQLRLAPERMDTRDLVALADRAVRMAFDAKGVQLIVPPVPAGLPILVDPERLVQVLVNLLQNALRHNRPGSSVRLRAGRARRSATVQIAVSDDGDGILAVHLPHIFERFYRVDTARDRDAGGTGIGLAIAKAIVESHGGEIHAASAGAGRGAVFTVTLPVAVPAPD